MGNCRYCGISAGLFTSAHKECEEKHSKGLLELKHICDNYFIGRCTAYELGSFVREIKSGAFLSDDELATVGNDAINNYCQALHRPYPVSILGICSDFITAINLSYSSLNAHGALDNLAIKLMKGFIADFFTDVLPLDKVMGRCQKIKSAFPISQELEYDVYMEMLEKASLNFLKDGVLSVDEQRRIDNFVSRVNIPLSNLPAKYQDSGISKVGQAAILRDLENGIYPQSGIQLPIILAKNEHILWVYNDVSMYMEKIERETIGRAGGFSFRVCKGVTYRVGQFKGHPVEHSRMNLEGKGALFVTNKNLIFYSPQKNNKVAFNKIVGITPYSDGIEVHKDGNAKRLTFTGFDSWFIMNLLSLVNDI